MKQLLTTQDGHWVMAIGHLEPMGVRLGVLKTFDRAWHAAIWATMQQYNSNANLVPASEQLYNKAISAVQMNGST